MSKRRYIVIFFILFISYNAFAWQHVFTNFSAPSELFMRVYYAGCLALFLATIFINYMLEKKHGLSKLATFFYILLFLTGAPFLYNLMLYIILVSIPSLLI